MAQDTDQGGVYTQWNRIYYGPTVGWIYIPILAGNLSNVVLGATEQITTTGTHTLSKSTCIVEININNTVTIQLNSSISGSQPTDYLGWPIVISDVGGHAGSNNITILPHSTELIMGQTSLVISADYGTFTLLPKSGGGWGIT